MATQTVLTKYRVPDYLNDRPLPDPPQQPDMMKQFPGISAFASALDLWFKDRDDVFVGALGYLWADPDDRSGPYRMVCSPRGWMVLRGYSFATVM